MVVRNEPLHARSIVATAEAVDVGCSWAGAFLASRAWTEFGIVPGTTVLVPAPEGYASRRPNGDISRVALCLEISRLGLAAELQDELSSIVREQTEQSPVRVQALFALREVMTLETERLLLDMVEDDVVGHMAMTVLAGRHLTSTGASRLRLAISQHGSRRGLWVQAKRYEAWTGDDIASVVQSLLGPRLSEALTVLSGVEGQLEVQVYDVLAEALRTEPKFLSAVLILAIVDRATPSWLASVVHSATKASCAATRELALQATSCLGPAGVDALTKIIHSNRPIPDVCAATLGISEVVKDIAVWHQVLQVAIARDDPRLERAVLIALQKSRLQDSGLARLVGELARDAERSVAELARTVQSCLRD